MNLHYSQTADTGCPNIHHPKALELYEFTLLSNTIKSILIPFF